MKILGIESSADETSASVVVDGIHILSNIVSSSMGLHGQTGGIIPEVAAREQLKFMIPVLNTCLGDAGITSVSDIDFIAVTQGPGLIGSLLVGVETAKTLSYLFDKPLIPVNHIFAHIYANWLESKSKPMFPAIALVVSGGHTELFYLKGHTDWMWIGGTLDDAAGEAFDKTARLLGFGYPGGPAIAVEAAKFHSLARKSKLSITLPRPMIGSKDFNFSFSGLKTAVMREVHDLKAKEQLNDKAITQLSFELQESITDVLVRKTLNAAKKITVRSILLGGGVSANTRLREKFELAIKNSKLKITLHIPSPRLCTDNAASIACMAYYHNRPQSWRNTQARPDFEVEV